jgi:DNA polymerase elongation subunit (family B)
MKNPMNKYYTNVYRTGNRLFVREIRDGKRRNFKTEYKPTLYVPTKGKAALHSPDGTPVEPLNPGTMGDCYQFLQKYKDVGNFQIFGNTAYEYTFINEEYPGLLNYKISEMVICNLDIEVAKTADGYSEARDAANEVTAITMKSSGDGIYHVFACQPFDDKQYNFEHQDTIIAYHQCEDEMDLFYKFLDLWERIEPDIVTGWNIRLYDIPYLVNRISRIMSTDDANRLSPWGMIKENTVNIFGNPEVVYDVAGLSILDYLLIYRKNVLEPRESYRLDYIAEVELGERKVDYGEYNDLQDLYERNFKKFIEYNIHDVRLVDRIEIKRKLIELQVVVAYHAKINFVDVLSQVRMWDTNICNHLLKERIVVPQRTDTAKDTQFAGAFVMQPIPGMYHWIASFDVQSLYPMIMRTLNMGMETKLSYKDLTPMMKQYQKYIGENLMQTLTDGSRVVNPDAIIDGMTEELMEHLREQDVSVGANGVFYRRDPKSFYSVMIEELFDNRLEYKKKLKAAKLELSTCTDSTRKAELEDIASIYDLKQHATKIMLNSLYGAMGNQYFRFFDVANAEAVTTTGQFIIQYIARGINAYLNKMMKTENKQFIVYSDTDSIYVTLETVVNKHHPHGTTMEKVGFVDRICKDAIQPQINRLFRYLTERYLNGVGEYLLMNREVIGDKGIWTAKKRYLINVRDKEGIRKEKAELKYMGVEIAKSSVPKFCRDAMKEAVTIVMEQDQETLFKFVADTEAKFKAQPIENVSFPRSVNGLAKYGHHETIYIKGTPFHTKGALMYNHMLDLKGMSNKYPKIKDGEKMKFFYLKEPNPLGVNAMAFLTKFPVEFNMAEFIDWDTQWEKSFIEPLKLILNAIKWDTQRRANLDALFIWDDDEEETNDEKADRAQYEETCRDESDEESESDFDQKIELAELELALYDMERVKSKAGDIEDPKFDQQLADLKTQVQILKHRLTDSGSVV